MLRVTRYAANVERTLNAYTKHSLAIPRYTKQSLENTEENSAVVRDLTKVGWSGDQDGDCIGKSIMAGIVLRVCPDAAKKFAVTRLAAVEIANDAEKVAHDQIDQAHYGTRRECSNTCSTHHE